MHKEGSFNEQQMLEDCIRTIAPFFSVVSELAKPQAVINSVVKGTLHAAL